MRPGTLARWQALRHILRKEISEGAYIIDIGGFDGYIPHQLKKQCPTLTVVIADIDREGLSAAIKRGLYAVSASGHALAVKDASFDMVFLFSVIEHVEREDALLAEIARILKPAGTLILSTPGKRGISFPFFAKTKNEALQRSWGHLRPGYSVDELVKLLEAQQLKVIRHYRYFNCITRFFYRVCLLPRLHIPGMAALYRLSTCLEPFITLGGQAHAVVAQKKTV